MSFLELRPICGNCVWPLNREQNNKTKCDCCSTVLCLEGLEESGFPAYSVSWHTCLQSGWWTHYQTHSLSHTHIHKETLSCAFGQTRRPFSPFTKFLLVHGLLSSPSTNSLLSSLNNSWTVKTKCEKKKKKKDCLQATLCSRASVLTRPDGKIILKNKTGSQKRNKRIVPESQQKTMDPNRSIRKR